MRRLGILIVLAIPLSLVFATSAQAASATYYVDCSAGRDTNAGTSTSAAWQSLSKANAASLTPGSALLLKRGCTWTGPLNARWSGTAAAPITIGSYGSGELPRIQNAHEDVMITGSYQVIREIFTRSDATGTDSGCQNARTGWRVGFRFMSGANNNTVRDSTANEHYIGILVENGAHHNKILNNTLQNNNMKDPNVNSDAGGVAISLMGDDNEVGYNYISGSDVCSRFYTRDGAAVEVYGGQRNSIHNNKSVQNNTFTELGQSRSANNTFAYNLVTSTLKDANFLVTRGAKDSHGPVANTKVYGSTVYLSGSASYAVQCTGGCSPTILSFKNNIIWSEDRIGYADANFDESNNIYWRSDGAPKVYFNISSSSRKVDPKWVNRGSLDLHLASGSPAIDAGSRTALDLGFNVDLDGVAVPQSGTPDIGAYERGGAAPPPPPAPPAGGTTYAADTFGRSLTDSWGSASTGGAYGYLGGQADFDVNGSAATMRVPSGNTRGAFLESVSAQNVDATFRVAGPQAATASGNFVYFVARRSASQGREYRLKLRIASNGQVFVHGTRVVSNAESDVGGEVFSGLTYAAGSGLRVRGQVTGSNPTTLRVKVWADGQSEPSAWQYSATDTTSALATTGAAGLRAYVTPGGSNAAMVFTFDDLRVVGI